MNIAILGEVLFPDLKSEIEDILEKNDIGGGIWYFPSAEQFLASPNREEFQALCFDLDDSSSYSFEKITFIRVVCPNIAIILFSSSFYPKTKLLPFCPIAYLRIPHFPEEICRSVLQIAQNPNRPYFPIWYHRNLVSLYYDDVVYVESRAHFVLIHTTSEIYSVFSSLSEIEEKINSPAFLRCHQSYLVNMTYIQKADRKLGIFCLADGTRIPIRAKSSGVVIRRYQVWCDRMLPV